MPIYHYIALSQTGKELSGVIEAQDDASARVHLNQLGLSVVSLDVSQAPATATTGGPATPPALPQPGKTIFEFEALDRKGKKVVGTIVSDNPVNAFARLFDEYQLNVTTLFASSAPPEEKLKAQKEGINELRQQYEKIFQKEKAQMRKLEAQHGAEEEAKRELLVKVDFTMQKMETFLKESNADLKPEERDTIQGYLNQLMRIKDSTNLEHIRSTCERMLEHIQKQELFVHQEQKLGESAKMKVETKELLSELKRTGLQQDIDLVRTASRWRDNPIFKPLGNFVLRILNAQNPQIMKVRDEIKSVNHHIFAYVKLFIFGKSKEVRTEALSSMKTLREEKKRLKLELQALKLEERKSLAATQPASNTFEQIGGVFGWVLAFYLATYLISYPLTIKQFNLPPIPKSLYFYQPQLTTGITIFLFLAYSALAIRNYWLKKHWGATLVLYPLTVFIFLLFAINLL